MTIAILWIGVTLVIKNQLTIGQLIAFQMFANQFTAPVMRLVNLWNEFQQVLLTKSLMVDGKEQQISTGMGLSAEIKTGKRRIIEFFIYPIVKYWSEAVSIK